MKKYGLTVIILLTICSCSYEDSMEKTVFIPDEENRNLPAYTEWGYNSFGAKYERTYFTSANDIVPCKVIYRNGILNFHISGRVGSGYNNGTEMTLTFSFPISLIDEHKPMNEYKDLMILHKSEIDLTNESCEVKIIKNSQTEILSLLSGHLAFKRAQLLRIDDKENRVILSGTFDVRFLRNELPEVLSNGRFDFGITDLYNLSE